MIEPSHLAVGSLVISSFNIRSISFAENCLAVDPDRQDVLCTGSKSADPSVMRSSDVPTCPS